MKLLPVLLVLLAAAQERPADAPADFGYTVQRSPAGDYYGLWNTFAVDLSNRASREREVQVRIEDVGGRSVALKADRLSPGARKRIFLYAPGEVPGRGAAAHYRITEGSGRELAQGLLPSPHRAYRTAGVQVAVLSSPSFALAEDLGIPSQGRWGDTRICIFSESTFPDRWIGLASVDLLLVHAAKLDDLSREQARALSDYVREGGSVLLCQGAQKGWVRHSVLAAFAPVLIEDPQPVATLPGVRDRYGPFRVADSFVASRIVGGQPLKANLSGEVHHFTSGFGRTYVLGFDLFRPPFDSWPGRRELWNDLLADLPRRAENNQRVSAEASAPLYHSLLFAQMAALINPYPPFELILGLGLFFLLLVGPLNYFVLWKLQRTLLLVVSVPAISFAFLGFIFVLGYVLKGTSTVVHSARLLSTVSGMDCAREVQFYSLFSPSTRTYDAECEPGTYALPAARTPSWDANVERPLRNSEPVTIENRSGLVIRGLGVGQWQTCDLEAYALREIGKGVRFSVRDGRISIANESGAAIERGVFVQTGATVAAARFGELGPGASAELAVPAPGTLPGEALGLEPNSLGDRIFRSWLGSIAPRTSGDAKPQRFLLCVLRDEAPTIRIDARRSDHSRSITLLHVREAR